MISFDTVSKRYRDVDALRDVSFSVRPGEVVGYIGPNGAGKTTTLRILAGLVSGYQGTVTLDGKDVESDRNSLHRVVGYLPQDTGFQEWRTSARALLTLGTLSGLGGDKLKRRVGAVLEMLGIGDYADRRINHLSGGTRQKLLFAQAILHDPQYIVLDEPLSGLDPASRFRLKEIVRTARSADRAVLFSSHVLADVEDLADRIVIINHGRIVAAGTPAELRSQYGSDVTIEIVMRADPVQAVLQSVGASSAASTEIVSSTRALLRYGNEAQASAGMKELLGHLARVEQDVRVVRRVEPSLEEIYIALTEVSE